MLTYKRNFLTRVLCRVDYEPILVLRNDAPAAFQELVRLDYPRYDVRRGIAISLAAADSRGLSAAQTTQPEHLLKDVSEQYEIVVTSEFVAFTAKHYTHFEDYARRVDQVVDALRRSYNPAIVRRIGLRYINEIRRERGDPFDWRGFVNDNLTAALVAFPDKQSDILRSMHRMDLRGEEYRLNFQFGAHNREYPNPIAQPEFILDYDCYTEDESALGDVMPTLREFNQVITGMFEASIGDDLRALMGIEDT